MRRSSGIALGCWVLLAASSSVVCAQATRFLTPSQDNSIFSNDNRLSSGRGVLVTGLTTQFGPRRALVKFDVAGSIPAGVRVTSVTLRMDASIMKFPRRTVDLHRLTASWGEGTSLSGTGEGAPATTGDATWAHRFFPNTFWSRSGGDFVAQSSARALVDVGPNAWSSPQMVADVQSWLTNPQSNHGWILIGDELQTSAVLFRSRETPALAPSLEVQFATQRATVSTHGIACGPTSAGVRLGAVGLPSLGNASFAIRITGGPPLGRGGIYLAPRLAATPVRFAGNCALHLDPAGAALFVSVGASPIGPLPLDAQGGATLPLPIPARNDLIGSAVVGQVLVVDSGAPAGFYLSNALTIHVGT